MTAEIPSLLSILAEIPDHRQAQGRRYPLGAMLTLVGVAMLCGYDNVKAIAEWGQNYGEGYAAKLGFGKHGYPSLMTWYRVLGGVEMGLLEAKLQGWSEQVLAQQLTEAELVVISVDGKTLRGSKKQGARESHLLAAFASPHQLVLGQIPVDEKTNEIGVAPTLLRQLNLKGRLVTADALLTQHKIVEQILAGGGDYLLPVKQNHENTFHALRCWFGKPAPVGYANLSAEVVEKSHGRLVKRRLNVTSHLNDYLEWAGVQQAFQLVSSTTHLASGKHTVELAYGMTSLSAELASPERLLTLIRQHWAIENSLHWVRDVTFHEDRSALRVGCTHHYLATFRNLTISLFHLAGFQQIAPALRFCAAQPEQAFALLSHPARM